MTMLLVVGGLAACFLFFLIAIGVLVAFTGKKPVLAPPPAPAPQPAPKVAPEDLLHAAFGGVRDYASRQAAVEIGGRLARYEAQQMATAIAEGVQDPKSTVPKG